MDIAPFLQVAILSVAAFLAAMGAWWVARKTGLSDVQEAVREEQLVLSSTLRARVEHLEGENKRQAAAIRRLEAENTALRGEIRELQRELIKLSLDRNGGE